MGGLRTLRDIESGYRLAKPGHMPFQLYILLIRCWDMVARRRPEMKDIVTELDKILENPSLKEVLDKVIPEKIEIGSKIKSFYDNCQLSFIDRKEFFRRNTLTVNL